MPYSRECLHAARFFVLSRVAPIRLRTCFIGIAAACRAALAELSSLNTCPGELLKLSVKRNRGLCGDAYWKKR